MMGSTPLAIDASDPVETPPVPIAAARTVNLVKTYGTGEATVHALDGVTVAFEQARFTAVMGPSGSGKSTLMHCMAGLDSVTSGTVSIGDAELSGLSDNKMTALRRDRSVLSSSPSTWCQLSPRSRTSRCRWIWPAGHRIRSGWIR